MIGLFAALSYVVMLLIHFPVSFLTLDVKDAVITLCGLTFGPSAALFVSVFVPFLEMITVSHTGIYGFVMNVLGSACFSVTAALVYRYKKSFVGAILGLISGICAMTAMMMLFNLIVTPWYMHVEVAAVARMIPTLLLPFNVVKAVLNAALVFLLYKPVSAVLQRTGVIPPSKATLRLDLRTVLASVVALMLVVASILVIFFVLGGEFRWGIA